MKIDLHHPRLPFLYAEAERRNLQLIVEGGGMFRVSSHSCRGLWRKVVVQPDGAICTCYSLTACTHIALALSQDTDHHIAFCEALNAAWDAERQEKAEAFNRKRLEAQRRVLARLCHDRQRAAKKAVRVLQRAYKQSRELIAA